MTIWETNVSDWHFSSLLKQIKPTSPELIQKYIPASEPPKAESSAENPASESPKPTKFQKYIPASEPPKAESSAENPASEPPKPTKFQKYIPASEPPKAESSAENPASEPPKPAPSADRLAFQSASNTIQEKPFWQGMLSIIVLGASGDLAKKKTFPSLMDLFLNGLLPPWVSIVGYDRSAQRSEDFHAKIRPWLLKFESSAYKVDYFLDRCAHVKGTYDSPEDFARLNEAIDCLETSNTDLFDARHATPGVANRLFYFGNPPDAFISSATSIKKAAMTTKGFNRLIVEKPFGNNLESAQQLVNGLGNVFTEDNIYRVDHIDHHLTKELVKNLYMFRFGFLEPAFNQHNISSIHITCKEPFGTEGRGGYFTNNGIIRDVIQNYLMQVLSIVAMEPPPRFQGEEAGDLIRDAKKNVLRCITPINPDEVVIGQYVGANGKPGYLEDDSIKDKEKASRVPTFAAIVVRINNPRWHGVPFVLKAGKALNESKVDVRVQYKDTPAIDHMFAGERCAGSELVMRLQPDPSVYMKTKMKEPGLIATPKQTPRDLSYKSHYKDDYDPDAYTSLILEALCGTQDNFVHSDELLNSWEIFDPLLLTLEEAEKRIPVPYAYGSRGPTSADALLAKAAGFKNEQSYDWLLSSIPRLMIPKSLF